MRTGPSAGKCNRHFPVAIFIYHFVILRVNKVFIDIYVRPLTWLPDRHNRSPRVKPCTHTIRLIKPSSMNASHSSAARPRAFSPGSFRRMNSARCGCKMAFTSRNTRPCCGWRFPTACCRQHRCGCSRISPANMIAAMAISRRARTFSSIGRNWNRYRISSPILQACKCMPSRLLATASVIPRLTSLPALPMMSWSIRARMLN